MMNLKNLLISFFLLLILVTAGGSYVSAARTDTAWIEVFGTWLEVPWDEGRDILIKGVNKYLNFGDISGETGYGFRDNAGTMEFKNSGGSWSAFGGGGGGSGTVTSVAMTTPTGLTVSGSPITTSGTLALALDTGYVIPLSASTTEWAAFYATPSSRIANGSHLSWSGNTLNVVTTGDWTGTLDTYEASALLSRANHTGTQVASTISDFDTEVSNNTDVAANTSARHNAVTLSGALDYITLVGQDIVRGAVDLATDITGALGIANGGLGAAYTDPNADQIMFWDDSAGAIKSLTTLTGAAISGTTLTINDVTCTDCLTTTEITDSYLLNTGDAGTGVYDFGGATSIEIVNGSGPTVDATGEVAFDTTDNQLLVGNSGGSARVLRTEERIFGFTLASSSPEFVSGGQVPVPLEKDGYTVTAIRCYVQGGTSVQMTLTDGTNAMDTLTCATTATSDDGSIANSSVTAAELMYVNVGTISSTPDYVTYAAFGYYTVE